MPPTRARRSIRMTFWSRDRYRLAANRAFSPAMPAPTMQTSQVSTRAGWDPVITPPFRGEASIMYPRTSTGTSSRLLDLCAASACKAMSTQRHGIASAQAMWPSRPSVVAMSR